MRLFVDMDGVLAEWKYAGLDEVTGKGYFRNLPAQNSVVEAVKEIIHSGKINVYCLSSVFQDDHSIAEKNAWLNQYLPEIPKERRIFSPYGAPKKEILSEHFPEDILLDDFTKNLMEWHGIGIKLLNGINDTNKSWTGFRVSRFSSSAIIANTILAIANAAEGGML